MIRYDDSCIVATFGSKANMVTPQVIQVANSGYQYQYNGKEWQDVLGLNVYLYGYRDYDTAIGRWNVIDQLSEKYHTSSPYTFVQNNPIINREIDGRYFDEKNEKKSK
jgi:RHS repeat-associated protein